VMDYPRAKFGDFSFSSFGSIARTDKITDAAKRFTPGTVISVSNYHGFRNTVEQLC